MKRPRIALVTSWDARTPASGSGISHYMARALERHVGEVVYLGPAFSRVEFYGKILNRVERAFSGKGRPYIHGRAMAREFGRIFSKRIPSGTDFIFGPMAGTQIAFLETSVPVVYSSDTTFGLLTNYYPEFTDLSERYRAEAQEIEANAINRSAIISYPSEWAARSAVESYGADPKKVHVVSWGANLNEVPAQAEIEEAKQGERCRLLFLGKDWERKGGPLACQTVLELRRRGLDAHLTVVGCRPVGTFDPDAVTVIGAIDKSDPDQRRRLTRHLLEAHFLLQPSRHESLGVVYCEASAHGTPSIATDTGGVGGVVFDGENGFRLPLTAEAGDYAGVISRIFRERKAYQALVSSTRHLYESRLNWDVWAQRMGQLMDGQSSGA